MPNFLCLKSPDVRTYCLFLKELNLIRFGKIWKDPYFKERESSYAKSCRLEDPIGPRQVDADVDCEEAPNGKWSALSPCRDLLN